MNNDAPLENGSLEEGFEETAESVRTALVDHTERVEIQPGAYTRLATRVADTGGSERGWSFGIGRSFAVGVAALAVVAGAGFAAARSLSDDDGVLVADGSASVGSTEPSLEPPRAGGDNADEAPEPPPEIAPEVLPTGPVGATRIEAAEAFASLIVDEPTDVAEINGDIVVLGTSEGSPEADHPIATLELVEAPMSPGSAEGESGREGVMGWTVRSATSPSVTIEKPLAGAVVGASPFTVAGMGTGFESTVEFEVRSALDGSLLLKTFTTVGNLATTEPYELTLDLAGTDRVWIVARSSGGADDVATSFAAVPVTLDGRPNPAPYVVTGVPLDDPDGGLNLRSAPGASSEKLAVLEWGQTVRRASGLFPAAVGDDIWWPIDDGTGTTGWVNARYLAGFERFDTDELIPLAEWFLMVAAEPDLAGAFFAGPERRDFVLVVDGELIPVDPSGLASAAGWNVGLDGGPSLSELVSAPADLVAELTIVPNGSEFDDEAMADVAGRLFGGLPWATASYLGADGEAHVTHLFIEQSPSGPRYTGAIIETES